MKTVKIKNCSYEEFEKIRDVIYDIAPFILAKEGYSKKTEIATFAFSDSSYIPKCLDPFIINITGNDKLIKAIHAKILTVPAVKKLNPI